MLRKRLIAAALFITPMVTLIWLDVNQNFDFPGFWLLPTALVLSVLIGGELMAMLAKPTPGAIAWVAYGGIVLCHLAISLPAIIGPGMRFSMWELQALMLFLTLAAAFGHEMWNYSAERPAITRIALTMLTVLYAGWLMSFLAATRLELSNAKGAMAIFSILFVIKMSDAGAYFAGKNLGRRKLAPVLSPGKTVEGLIGGMLAAIFAAFLILTLVAPRLLGTSPPPWWAVFGYGVSLLTSGVLGDLAESLIKRNMDCKDSSGWLPGLGGIMDTADSVVLSAPVAYVWWMSGLL